MGSIESAVDRADERIDELWNALRGHPLVDRAFYTASELGDFSLIWHLLGAMQGVAHPPAAIRLAAALGAESALVNGGIKSLFKRERPIPEFERPYNLRQPLTSSFPSGHASAGFMAAVLLSEGSRRKAPYFAAAAFVATSRMHVRIHHASDVVSGAALGLTLGALVRRIAPMARWPRA